MGGTGLPAREPCGVPFADGPLRRSFGFFLRLGPSLISGPEPEPGAVVSPSLLAWGRGRLCSFFDGRLDVVVVVVVVVVGRSVSLEGSRGTLTADVLRLVLERWGRDEEAFSGADESGGAGERGREPGAVGVDVPVGWEEERPCFFLCFLREDSVPLASERLGEPGRLRELVVDFLRGSLCLGRPEGVLVPLVEAPDGRSPLSLRSGRSFSVAAFFSSSFFRSSSFRRSVSVSSDSLWVRC